MAAEDSSLDFCSEEFNPLKALRAEESLLSLPCPEVSACYSLKHYQTLMKAKQKTEASEPQKQPKVKPNPSTIQPIKSILTFMPEHTEGPLSVFKVAMTTKEVINVWTRHSAGLRGVCTGKIRAFDRHWNIVMYDVIECYTPLKTTSNGGKERKIKHRVRKRKKSIPRDKSNNDKMTVDPESIDDQKQELISSEESSNQQKDPTFDQTCDHPESISCIKSVVSCEVITKSRDESVSNESVSKSRAESESKSIYESVSESKSRDESVSRSKSRDELRSRVKLTISTNYNLKESISSESRSRDHNRSSNDEITSNKRHEQSQRLLVTDLRHKLLQTSKEEKRKIDSTEKEIDATSHTGNTGYTACNTGHTTNRTKWEITRYVKQLFIRGDNIMFVTKSV